MFLFGYCNNYSILAYRIYFESSKHKSRLIECCELTRKEIWFLFCPKYAYLVLFKAYDFIIELKVLLELLEVCSDRKRAIQSGKR